MEKTDREVFDAAMDSEILLIMAGVMEEMPCEGENHGRVPAHDDGPARWYLQLMHDCSWAPAGTIYAMCDRASKHIASFTRRVRCYNCHQTFAHAPTEWVRVIGPIKRGGGDD